MASLRVGEAQERVMVSVERGTREVMR